MMRKGLLCIKRRLREGIIIVTSITIAMSSMIMGENLINFASNSILKGIYREHENDYKENDVVSASKNEVIGEPTSLYALSAALIDAETGRVLFEKDGYTVRANASTTKILTCILAIESGKLEDIVTVSKYAASMPDVQLNIREGEKYKLKDLLYSLMLESHNDVAVAIAEYISGSVDEFSKLMNKKCKEIGCENTYFITPNGLDGTKIVDGQEKIHGTTAVELAKIMSYCINNQQFVDITTTAAYTFTDKIISNEGNVVNGTRVHTVSNKNALLTMMDGVISGKTGFTGRAGYCYVCAVENNGRKYAVALLGCGWPNNKNYKWSDTKKLLGYGMEYYVKKDVFDYEMAFDEIPVNNGVVGRYDVYGENGINADITPVVHVGIDNKPLTLLLKDNEEINKQVWIFTRLEAPVNKGDKVGYVRYVVGEQIVGQYDIYALNAVNRKDFSWAYRCILNKFLMH